jgi:hypothetical protein
MSLAARPDRPPHGPDAVRIARVVVASALLTLSIAALARAPYTPPGASDAILRFSWRMSASAREHCRPRTQQELDALPVHMRTPDVCTRDTDRYILVTRIDDGVADTLDLVRGGAKGDRPIFVLDERRLSPGTHRVGVELLRLDSAGAATVVASLDSVLVLRRGGVQLVTLQDDGRTLAVRSSP